MSVKGTPFPASRENSRITWYDPYRNGNTNPGRSKMRFDYQQIYHLEKRRRRDREKIRSTIIQSSSVRKSGGTGFACKPHFIGQNDALKSTRSSSDYFRFPVHYNASHIYHFDLDPWANTAAPEATDRIKLFPYNITYT